MTEEERTGNIELKIPFRKLTGTGGNFRLSDPSFFAVLKSELSARAGKAGNVPELIPDRIGIEKRYFDFRTGREPCLGLCLKIINSTRSDSAEIAKAAPGPSPAVCGVSDGCRPVVVGFGPAGMFCALTLSRRGLKPLVIERGESVDSREKTVRKYWETGELSEESNVQFGEGGAGAFSDGKLTTLVKEKHRTGRTVLETFARFGAPEDILIDTHPHIGTDLLREVVRNIRNEIIRLGGTVEFGAKLTGIEKRSGRVEAISYEKDGRTVTIETEAVFLAIGHSARDTFEYLHASGVEMMPKPMAVGFRIEHPQKLINDMQYGRYSGLLSEKHPAIYKLSCHFTDEGSVSVSGLSARSAFTFCMCPGGYIVNASSERGGLVTNGMSYSDRSGVNANSAVLAGVFPSDYIPFESFPGDPLSGMRFQRRAERNAFELTGRSGRLPYARLGDVSEAAKAKTGDAMIDRVYEEKAGISNYFGSFGNQTKGLAEKADLTEIYPYFVTATVLRGISRFNRMIPGFSHPDAIMTGPETRSSSPVRIVRDPETFESISLKGLYPVGEGAGYAGGITSSGIDGIKAAESFLRSLDN